ncbi:MAG: SGNH/GDSL hydrolase family protein [Ruminococcaceae bacterium]|nr:SGNH/GDSL hydrolase family protein [Oscillospiraceae bacterium]
MLANTVFNLKKNKKLNIGYYGGSITLGGCADDPEKESYRALLTNWFRTQYPDVQIREIQAAISGTGSELGMHRCESDLLNENPDLIFLEYTVNDYGIGYEKICAQFETIIRMIYVKNPFADIVVLTTITEEICNVITSGKEFVSRNAHMAVAHHYNLPVIDIGAVLWANVMREGGDFLRYTTDTIHPNNDGHALYAKTISTRLKEYLQAEVPAFPVPVKLEKHTFCSHLHMNAHVEDCLALADVEIKGFTLVEKSMFDRHPHYIESSTPGDSISFTFVGENAGFYWIKADDSGDVLVSVDGKKEITISAWDCYCPGGARLAYSFFAGNLPYGKHKVVVRIAETKAEESKGHAIRIGAMLIS